MASFKLCIALLLVASATVAYGLLDNLLGSQVSQINVLGRLACSASGNFVSDTASPPIAGVDVIVKCNGGQLSLGTLTTNTTGFFDGLLKTVDGILFDPSTCVAQVKLPIVSCDVFPPTGILQTVLNVGGLLNTLLGLVASLVGGVWQVLSI